MPLVSTAARGGTFVPGFDASPSGSFYDMDWQIRNNADGTVFTMRDEIANYVRIGGSIFLRPRGNGQTLIQGGDASTRIAADTNGIGFFGSATTPKAAHPATLADVITLLATYGLCA